LNIKLKFFLVKFFSNKDKKKKTKKKKYVYVYVYVFGKKYFLIQKNIFFIFLLSYPHL